MKNVLAVAVLLFVFAVPALAVCPSGPGIVSPTGTVSVAGGSVTLKWTAVSGAASYDIYFGTQGACSMQPVATVTGTTFNPPPQNVEPGQTYEWRVVANNVAGCTAPPSSTCATFNTRPCPTSAPSIISPANNTTVSAGAITLKWATVTNATEYEVFVGYNGANPSSIGVTSGSTKTITVAAATNVEWYVTTVSSDCVPLSSSRATFNTGTACPDGVAALSSPSSGASFAEGSPILFAWSDVNAAQSYDLKVNDGSGWRVLTTTNRSRENVTLPAGTYDWEVRTNFANSCPSTSSERRRITVTAAANCNNTAPVLLSPVNGASVSNPVTFRWQAVPGATKYNLFVSIDGGTVNLLTSTTATEYQATLSGTSVLWAVAAVFGNNCGDLRSEAARFTLAAPSCPFASIELQSPVEAAQITSPVTLSWSAVANAAAYRVWVSIDGGAPLNIVRTATNSANVTLPSGTMKWYVEALRVGCDPIVSATRSFIVRAATDCASRTAPTLVGPIGASGSPVTVQNPVELRWNAAPNAIAYRVFIAAEGQPFEDLGLTRDTQVTRNLEASTYRWYVQALYENCPAVPSAQGYFRIERASRCTTAAPTILSPTEGSSSTAPVTFSWTAVEGASKYRIYASLDGADAQLIGVTEETSLSRLLPPGTIIFTVEAVFANCPSTFSARTRFTVPRAQNCSATKPTLVGPSNGSSSSPGNITFSWQPVSGAIRYVVVVQPGEGARTPIGETELTSLQRKLPAGRYTWSVVAFFAGCDPVESDRATFTLTTDAACDANRGPILLSPTERDTQVTSPVHFEWSSVPRAKGYQLWIAKGAGEPVVAASTKATEANVTLAPGNYRWYVEVQFENCPNVSSAQTSVRVNSQSVDCIAPVKPEAQVVGQTLSGTPYKLRWTKLPQVELYEVQESASLDFSNATTRVVQGASAAFVHEVTVATQFLYRVRGISNCNDERGPFSDVAGVFVIPPQSRNGSTEVGTESNVVQTIFLPGSTTPLQFVATADKPWLTVTPSSGTLPVTGITLTVTADPTVLALGTNTGTVKVTYSGNGKTTSHASTVSTVPISISIVTPVTPAGKGTPPPDALIIPAVAHAVGANDSFFESDIRVTNLGATTMKYSINFTPSGADGTQKGSSSTVEIAPNQTLALDDVMATLFGSGSTSVIGMLEIRPTSTTTTTTTTTVGKSTQIPTVASSRTYNLTPNGTFGQYIPALPFSTFVGKSSVLSLQQIAQSESYRTNFGFVEASGQAATLTMRVYDTANHLIGEIPVSLQPGEHKQVNNMLSANGISNLADGRVEIEVTSSTGKVTAYASTVDNKTNDPLMVWPVVKGATTANRYTLPGMATINTGAANWRSDVRLFNAGAATPATLTFYPQGNPGAPVSREITLDAGEVEVIDDVLSSLFAEGNGAGGSLVVTTPASSAIVASARTYNQTTNGTYGQFIPGVTAAQSIGNGDRALQILQLEQSSRIRTNIGFAETTGQPVTVEVALVQTDTKSTPFITYELAPHEFRQVPLAAFGVEDALYNARVTVKVVGGAGRVTAYGSAIDSVTQDPTYVPAQ